MRYQGKITNWNDEQGFGFVSPNGGGQRAFVHVSAFVNRAKRPSDGTIITYELTTDTKGRFCAKQIQFTGERVAVIKQPYTHSFGIYYLVLFITVMVAIAFTHRILFKLVAFYITLSVVTFLVYAIDKSAAINNRWRTKENTLHVLGLIGGWPGALIAQKTLRHKSIKQEFQIGFWLTVFVNSSALYWLAMTETGATYLKLLTDFSFQ